MMAILLEQELSKKSTIWQKERDNIKESIDERWACRNTLLSQPTLISSILHF